MLLLLLLNKRLWLCIGLLNEKVHDLHCFLSLPRQHQCLSELHELSILIIIIRDRSLLLHGLEVIVVQIHLGLLHHWIQVGVELRLLLWLLGLDWATIETVVLEC